MHVIFFDPQTKEWIPDVDDYIVTRYDQTSFLVQRRNKDEVDVVDLEDYQGSGSCTCPDFAYRKDPNNLRQHLPNLNPQQTNQKAESCKHIRLVRLLLR